MTLRRLTIALLATTLLTAAAACSSSAGNYVAGPPSSAPAAASANSGNTIGAPPGAKILGTPRIGEPFTIVITYVDNSPPSKFQITVNSVTCGKGIDPAVVGYAATSQGETPKTPTPEPGKQFCMAAMEAANVGNSEANWSADNTVSLNVGSTQYSENSSDSTLALDYAQYWQSRGQTGPSFGLQPNSKGPEYGVFELPVGTTPDSLWVSSGTAITTIQGVQPGYLVAIR